MGFVSTSGLARGAIAIDDGVIAAIAAEPPAGATVLDWSHCLLAPGGVNVHNHSFQALLRGIADDRPFLQWRDEALYGVGPRLTPDDVHVGALLAFGEMLNAGTTTVCDFFYLNHAGNEHAEAVIAAAKRVGIRLVLARCLYDWEGAPACFRESPPQARTNFEMLHARYRNHPLVAIQPAPHSLHGASRDMLELGRDLAAEVDCGWHIHLSEERYQVEECLAKTGKRPLHYLADEQLLDERMIAVHGCWFDASERQRFAEVARGLAYNPASNMFLGDGITDVVSLHAAGVTIGLGTDGGCSNSRHSIYDEMRQCALLQKVANENGEALSAEAVLSMGTEQGAQLLGFEGGGIAPGAAADLVAIDVTDLSMQPLINPVKNLVYSMQPTALAHVMVAGKVVSSRNRLLRMDQQEITSEVAALLARLDLPPSAP